MASPPMLLTSPVEHWHSGVRTAGKMVFTLRLAGALLGLTITARHALAQFPPPLEGVTVLKSKFDSDITISYKEV